MSQELERQSIEQQLFINDSWEVVDYLILQYYDVVLKVDIGEFKAGSKFECVYLDFENSLIVLMMPDNSERKFVLKLSVAEEII